MAQPGKRSGDGTPGTSLLKKVLPPQDPLCACCPPPTGASSSHSLPVTNVPAIVTKNPEPQVMHKTPNKENAFKKGLEACIPVVDRRASIKARAESAASLDCVRDEMLEKDGRSPGFYMERGASSLQAQLLPVNPFEQLEMDDLHPHQEVYLLQQLSVSSTWNLMLAVLCLLYMAVVFVLIGINWTRSTVDTEFLEWQFHWIEFWGQFVFAVLSLFAISANNSRGLTEIYHRSPFFLQAMVFLNICMTFFPAVLVTLDLSFYEVICHEIEYSNEIVRIFLDVVLFSSMSLGHGHGFCNVRRRSPRSKEWELRSKLRTYLGGGTLFVFALLQLLLYNGIIPAPMSFTNDKGEWVPTPDDGENMSHFLEFVVSAVSAGITFAFCIDSKFRADQDHNSLLFHDQRRRSRDVV